MARKSLYIRIDFNTTIVSVREFMCSSYGTFFEHFNTTIVSVRAKVINGIDGKDAFQYNDCVGSSPAHTDVEAAPPRFQYNDCVGSSD